MDKESSLPLLEDDEQYEAAGWLSTLAIMGAVGETYSDKYVRPETRNQIGAAAFDLCMLAYKQPSLIVPTISEWIETDDKKMLNSLHATYMVTTRNELDLHLQLAHNLMYENDANSMQAYYESNFQRLEEDIKFYADFYQPRVDDAIFHHHGIGPELKRIQLSSAFYIGFDDKNIKSKSA